MKDLFKVLKYLKAYKTYALLNVLFNILAAVFGILSLLVLGPFLDILFETNNSFAIDGDGLLNQFINTFKDLLSEEIKIRGKQAGLILVCQIIVVIFFFKNLFRYLALFVMAPVRNGLEKEIRLNLFNKLLFLQLSYFSEQKKGDILARLTSDIKEIQWSVLRALESVIRSPIEIIGSFAVMIQISKELTLFSFILGIFVAIVIGGVGRKLKKSSAKAQQIFGSLLSTLEETLGGLKVIASFRAEHYQEERFSQQNHAYYKIHNSIRRRQELASPLTEFLGISVVVVLLWFGGSLVFDGDFVASMFVTFILMFYNILTPAKSLSTTYYDVQKGLAASERVNAVLDTKVTIKSKEKAQAVTQLSTAINLQNVFFAYEEEQWVLNNINIEIPKGKVVALVGLSGSGKSTLVDLLPRFIDVSKGSIQWDGVDIRDLKLEDLRDQMGIVSQEAILFNDSIYNNIVFGLEGATEAAVITAAKIANAHEFIEQQTEGYATVIGDRGSKLSGGQRQRITIARAILRNPEFLILDEATSALDSESEHLVQEALQKVLTNRTAIVIAHRLSTIQHADEIIVMDQGVIVERGTHQDLIAKKGAYNKLVELQQM